MRLLADHRRTHTRKAWPLILVVTIGLLLALLLAERLNPTSSKAPEHWQWITCDVGQGDAHLIRVSPTSAYLLDTGEDFSSLSACLDWAGSPQLEAVLITHAHHDHDGAYPQLAASQSLPMTVVSAHYQREQLPSAQFTRVQAGYALGSSAVTSPNHPQGLILWPEENPPPGSSNNSTWVNNTSLVIHWRLPAPTSDHRELTVLSTGDIEAEAAHHLIRQQAANLPADVLKIAHHGAAGSGTDLITATDPALAVISVGQNNSYGHPHTSILDHLHTQQISTARTDTRGHIALEHTGEGITISSSH